jgi:saccharopine dehydrogenase-like NADP-dependent oxidoreductase
MHALVLGGAGEVGRPLTRSLAEAPEIGRLTLADVDDEAARALSAQIGGDHIDVARVDIRDERRLVELTAASDCLVNCTPFPHFDAVIEAAFAARVDYVDFISEPTAEQGRRAAECGITAISGVGLSPGSSNVLCAHAAAHFDEPEEFHVNFASFRTIAPSEGLLDTILWELGNECPTRQYFHNGRYVWVPPFEGSHTVRFPDPVGEQNVYVVPHTETVTLPRNFPEVKFVAVRGTWPPDLMRDIATLNKYGLLDQAPVGDESLSSFEATKRRIWQTCGGKRETLPVWSSFVTVEAIGTLDSQLVRRDYTLAHEPWGTEAVGPTAGIHGAIAVRLLARHGRTETGFVDPERYFDPAEYVDELQRQPDIHLGWEDQLIEASARERIAS